MLFSFIIDKEERKIKGKRMELKKGKNTKFAGWVKARRHGTV